VQALRETLLERERLLAIAPRGTHWSARPMFVLQHRISPLRFAPACGEASPTPTALPGGDIADRDMERFIADVLRRWPFLQAAEASRMAGEEWAMSAEDLYWRHTKAGVIPKRVFTPRRWRNAG
jgi:glycerol-3-phosphate dehydrogenase